MYPTRATHTHNLCYKQAQIQLSTHFVIIDTVTSIVIAQAQQNAYADKYHCKKNHRREWAFHRQSAEEVGGWGGVLQTTVIWSQHACLSLITTLPE